LANGELYDHVAQIDFIDVQVDPSTDTVTVRAVIDNPDSLLIDQQLVTAVVGTAKPSIALLVPQQAVLTDQGGRFVFVVGADNTVEQRTIDVGATVDGSYVVRSGLEDGEQVITEGLQRVRPGMTVDPAPAGGA
jgi:membrane fusion protein (multidrug efflux system)